jgi:hypothetical protein
MPDELFDGNDSTETSEQTTGNGDSEVNEEQSTAETTDEQIEGGEENAEPAVEGNDQYEEQDAAALFDLMQKAGFKTVDDFVKSHQELRADHTRKSQRLAELERAGLQPPPATGGEPPKSDEDIIAELMAGGKKPIEKIVAEFYERKQADARDYPRVVKPIIEKAWESVLESHKLPEMTPELEASYDEVLEKFPMLGQAISDGINVNNFRGFTEEQTFNHYKQLVGLAALAAVGQKHLETLQSEVAKTRRDTKRTTLRVLKNSGVRPMPGADKTRARGGGGGFNFAEAMRSVNNSGSLDD